MKKIRYIINTYTSLADSIQLIVLGDQFLSCHSRCQVYVHCRPESGHSRFDSIHLSKRNDFDSRPNRCGYGVVSWKNWISGQSLLTSLNIFLYLGFVEWTSCSPCQRRMRSFSIAFHPSCRNSASNRFLWFIQKKTRIPIPRWILSTQHIFKMSVSIKMNIKLHR